MNMHFSVPVNLCLSSHSHWSRGTLPPMNCLFTHFDHFDWFSYVILGDLQEFLIYSSY